jgi:hypothetical protein
MHRLAQLLVTAAYEAPAVGDVLPVGEDSGMKDFEDMTRKRSRVLQVRL